MTSVTELLGNPESVGVWNLVPERSRITFRNKTMWGALRVHGVFTEFSGDGQITATGKVFGRVDIKAASLNTKLRKRDEDLRGPTFLDVEKYPDIGVVVTSAEPTGGHMVDVRAISPSRGTPHRCRYGPTCSCSTAARSRSPRRPPSTARTGV